MKKLLIMEKYSREAVHNIFDPLSPFTPSRGTWGLHGIVSLRERPGDFVFFVTLGHKEGNYEFKEGITKNGILTWQSQPKQKLSDPKIQKFVNHDHLINNIYLFLRPSKINAKTKKSESYYYLGRIAYISHDPQKEQPVHFKWQLLDWDLEQIQRNTILYKLLNDDELFSSSSIIKNSMTLSKAPQFNINEAHRNKFHAKKVDFAEGEEKNRILGLAGEELVIKYEKKKLEESGREDLAKNVLHTSLIEGDGAGYDILSWTTKGEKIFIEVKTTTGGINTPFYMSRNEVMFSNVNAEHYCLYRLYEFDKDNNQAKFYVKNGDISQNSSLTPTQFSVI